MKKLMVVLFVLLAVGLSAEILKMQNFENFKSDNWSYNSNEIKQSRKVQWGPTDKTVNGITAKAGSWYWLGKGLGENVGTLTLDPVSVVKDDISNYEIKFYYYTVGLGTESDFIKYSISYDNGKSWTEMGNLKDGRLEQIANKGNGTYGYIDNILEAKKVFVNELSSSLFTIAKDVKIQVEFNPAWVRGYRLIGYENRMLKKEDFKDDTKDAGELGARHTVTAIYEIVPVDSKEDVMLVDDLRYQEPKPVKIDKYNKELLLVKLRYKLPEGEKSIPFDKPLLKKVVKYKKCSEAFRFSTAVVGYAMLLQNHPSKGDLTWDMVHELSNGSTGEDKFGYRAEFLRLAEIAELLQK
ncbi:MAG: DUF3520 domain-containing protein [Candidatus Zophobacter franzmannii]|nr:DUF3520 domain-containing protein [Candidatus Zophobacter franzmannii]